MPRPPKCRRVCSRPATEEFAPAGRCGRNVPCVVLGMDEYEAIRLIDLLRMTQAQCAEQMGISRTTVTNIYDTARGKIADALVHGKRIVIRGGNVHLCDGAGCPHPHCQRRACPKGAPWEKP